MEDIQKVSDFKVLDFEVFPVDTRRRFNVYKTSIRRQRCCIDVLQTLKLLRVSTGLANTRAY